MPVDSEELDVYDIYGDGLGLFGEAAVAQGMPGECIEVYGCKLRLPDVPGGSGNDTNYPCLYNTVSLMSHYLWNSSLVMAEYIQDLKFPVTGMNVLELGSGAGLPGILSAKMGAKLVCLSDYPDPVITSNLEHNASVNIVDPNQYRVVPHKWGTSIDALLECNSKSKFDVILLSDILWISDQHKKLLETCTGLLSSKGKIYLTCGVHSGWTCVERFFEMAQNSFGLNHKQMEKRTSHPWGENAADAIDDIALRNRTILVYEMWF